MFLVPKHFGSVSPTQRDMSEIIERFFGRPAWSQEGSVEGYFPACNIAETADDITVTAELPGVDPKDVDISVQDNVLTMKGEKKVEIEQKGETMHRVERTSGSFTRSITLPAGIDVSKVAADYSHGVLRVVVPKAAEAKKRRVQIQVK